MKDGVYILFGRQEAAYRTMTDAKADFLGTKTAMRMTKPTTTAGSMLVHCFGRAAKRHIPKSLQTNLQVPCLMRAGRDNNWARLGPLSQETFNQLRAQGSFDKMYKDLDHRMMGINVSYVIVCTRNGKPISMEWFADNMQAV